MFEGLRCWLQRKTKAGQKRKKKVDGGGVFLQTLGH